MFWMILETRLRILWEDFLNRGIIFGLTVDVYDSFLLFVEMSSDVFAEDLPSCF